MLNQFIQNMPKAELNIHIEGTLEPDLMFKLAERNNVRLPYRTAAEMHSAYRFTDLHSFLDVYYAGLKVLITEQDFYELTWAYLQKAASQNIRHTEIFFDPQAHIERDIKFETVINGMHRAIKDGEKKLGISAHLIMCFMRDLGEAEAQSVLEQALPFKDRIVAVGLDSLEMGYPPAMFDKVFENAHKQGFLSVAIAGEVGPPEYIWQALDVLKVSRIDHGVRCIEDPDLMEKLAATKTPVTVCPISNLRLGICKTMSEHPLKKMFQDGLCVTVNSDDPAYFEGYVNENFSAVSDALQLSKMDIYAMAKNSFNASFLDEKKKKQFLKELDAFYATA